MFISILCVLGWSAVSAILVYFVGKKLIPLPQGGKLQAIFYPDKTGEFLIRCVIMILLLDIALIVVVVVIKGAILIL